MNLKSLRGSLLSHKHHKLCVNMEVESKMSKVIIIQYTDFIFVFASLFYQYSHKTEKKPGLCAGNFVLCMTKLVWYHYRRPNQQMII